MHTPEGHVSALQVIREQLTSAVEATKCHGCGCFLGIERLIENTLANPHVRFLLVCGDETRQAIGHLSGQTLQSLVIHGVDACGRIREARGKRPVLKNVTPEEIQAFQE